MKCIICGSRSWAQYLPDLQICQKCSLVIAEDKYFKLNSKKLYSSASFFNHAVYANYDLEKKALEKNFKNRLKEIRRFKNNGKLLDIGCASGYFLNIAKQYFTSEGVDLDPKVTEFAAKFSSCKIHTGDFLNQTFKNSSFDVITLFDTIEHLKKPKHYIAKSHQLLKKGGIIAIETGDISGFLPTIQKRKWRLIFPPFHLFYFSTNTLKKLLEQNGFQILTVKKVNFYRTLAQTIYKLVNKKNILRFLKPAFSVTFPINTFDIIFVIAKKI